MPTVDPLPSSHCKQTDVVVMCVCEEDTELLREYKKKKTRVNEKKPVSFFFFYHFRSSPFAGRTERELRHIFHSRRPLSSTCPRAHLDCQTNAITARVQNKRDVRRLCGFHRRHVINPRFPVSPSNTARNLAQTRRHFNPSNPSKTENFFSRAHMLHITQIIKILFKIPKITRTFY